MSVRLLALQSLNASPSPDLAEAPTATVATATATEGENNVDILLLILKIASLAPIIANGVVVVKHDCDLNQKQQAASDALDTVVNGITAAAGAQALSTAHASAVAAVAGLAKESMNGIIAALHNGAQAPAATVPAAA